MSERTEDQQRLQALVEEIDAILKKHEIAGVCFLASRKSSAWVHHLPKWTGIVETITGLDLDLAEDDGRIDVPRAESAIHVLGCLRDLAYDCTTICGRLFRIAARQIRVIGGGLMFAAVEPGGEPIDPKKAN